MLHIIVNPAGAAGKTIRYFRNRILPLFAGADYQIHYSTREQGIRQIVETLTDPSARGEDNGSVDLVIVGGDGSMNDMVNGIRDFGHTRVGLIPAGTGNDLARGLDLPEDPAQIAERILRRETCRQIDVGETIWHDKGQKSYFNVSSGAGFDAECCEMAANAPMKAVLNKIGLGKLIYIFEAMKLILGWKDADVTVTFAPRAEGEEPVEKHYDRFAFSAAMNGCYEGGGYMLSPKADPGDGRLDVCIIHDLTRLGFFRFFPLATKGRHAEHREITQLARRTGVRIRSDRPLWVHCDGEVSVPSSDVEMRISGHKLNLLV